MILGTVIFELVLTSADYGISKDSWINFQKGIFRVRNCDHGDNRCRKEVITIRNQKEKDSTIPHPGRPARRS